MMDNDILGALRCCGDFDACDGCTYEDVCGGLKNLTKSATDIIIRQKAEIEKKDIEIDILIRKKEMLRDEISKLHEEVLKGNTFTIKFDDELNERVIKRVIERLIQRYIELTKDKGAKRFGKWLFKRRYYEADECNCSLCGQLLTTPTGTRMNFCPSCGADMKCLEGGENNV